MQYYVHSHGFGANNRQCLALLLKGLRQFDYHAQDDESTLLQPRSMWPDNTRVERPLGQSVYGLPQPPRPFGSPTLSRPTRPAEDPNAGKWRLLARGRTLTLEPHMRVQKVSMLGHDLKDYFVFADHRFAEVDLQTHRVHWFLYTNRQEINYYKYGYYTPRPTGDGIDDLDQLKRAIRASKEFLGPELAKRVDEFTSVESLQVMAAFGALYVTAQLTPIGWAADAIMAVLFIGGCILMGPELWAIADALNKFYTTATNAANNEAKYREAGEYFAEAISKIGFDVLLGILLHKASVPLQRKLVRIRASQGLAAGEPLSGRRVAPAVEEQMGSNKPKAKDAEAEAKRKAEIDTERAKRKEQEKAKKKEKEAKKKAEQEEKKRIADEKAKAIEDLEKRYAPDQPPAEEYAKIEAEHELKYGSNASKDKVITVITDKKTGKVYTGRSGEVKKAGDLDPRTQERLPKESQHKNGETWDTHNCAEVDAMDQAIKDGADPADLEMHTVEIDSQTGQIKNKERCENCKVTTHDIETTSDPKK